MRCQCSPPLPAKLAQVQKAGDNFGRSFYTCPNRTCKLFAWADGVRATPPTGSTGGAGAGGTTTTTSSSSSGGGGGGGYASLGAVGAPPAVTTTSSIATSSIPMMHGGSSTSKGSSGSSGIKIVLGIGEIDTVGLEQRVWVSVLGPNDNRLYRVLNGLPAEAKRYHHGMRMWMVDLAHYERFVCDLRALECFDVAELPRFLQHGLPIYLKHLPRSVTEPDLMPKMASALLPFQLDGLRFVIRHGGRALIGDEMGCGKTVSAIAILQHYRREMPALILVPANLSKQWRAELLNYASDMLTEADVCLVTKSSDTVRGKVCIVPYSVLDKLADRGALRAEQFGIVIADESHQLKNKDAKRTEIAVPFIKRANVAICLSGTPILNRPVEMYTQLNALLPRVFSSYEEFTQRYCNARPSNFGGGWDVSGSSNERELNLLLEVIVMIRRLKADVVKSLPAKRREIRYIKPDPAYAGQLHAIQRDQQVLIAAMQASGHDAQVVQKLKRDQQQNTLRYNQITGLSKVAGVSQIIRELIAKAREPLPPSTDPDTTTITAATVNTMATTSAMTTASTSVESSHSSATPVLLLPPIEDIDGDIKAPQLVMLDLTGEAEDNDTAVTDSNAENTTSATIFPSSSTSSSGRGDASGAAGSREVDLLFDDAPMMVATTTTTTTSATTAAATKKEEAGEVEDWMRDSDDENEEECEGLTRLKRNARKRGAETAGAAEGVDGSKLYQNMNKDTINYEQQDDDADDDGLPVAKRRALRSSTLHRRVAYTASTTSSGSDGEEDDIFGSTTAATRGPSSSDKRSNNKSNTKTTTKSKTTGRASKRMQEDDDDIDGDSIGILEAESDGDDLFFLDKPATRSSGNNNGHSSNSNRKNGIYEYNPDDYENAEEGHGEDGDEGARKSAALWRDILDGKGASSTSTNRRRGLRGKQSPEAGSTTTTAITTTTTDGGKGMKSKVARGGKASLFQRKSKLNQKIIIFAHHREVMDRLEACLREEDVDFIRMDGAVNTGARNSLVLDFQQNDEADVALLSLSACGTGLNLTAASTALFAELAWSPGTILQAEDRIHRIGQKSSTVRIVYAIAEGSADDIVWEQIQKKHSVVGATVGTSDAGNRMAVSKSDHRTSGQQTLDDMLSQQPAVTSSATAINSSSSSSSSNNFINISNNIRTKSDDVYSKSVAIVKAEGNPATSASATTTSSTTAGGSIISSSSAFDFDNIPADVLEQQMAIAESIYRKTAPATTTRGPTTATSTITSNSNSTGTSVVVPVGKRSEGSQSQFVYSLPDETIASTSSKTDYYSTTMQSLVHEGSPRTATTAALSTTNTTTAAASSSAAATLSKAAVKTNSAAVYGASTTSIPATAHVHVAAPVPTMPYAAPPPPKQQQQVPPTISTPTAPPSAAVTIATTAITTATAAAAATTSSSSSSSGLDAATLRRMEEKKREALQRLEQRKRAQQQQLGQGQLGQGMAAADPTSTTTSAPATGQMPAGQVVGTTILSNSASLPYDKPIYPVAKAAAAAVVAPTLRSPAKVSPSTDDLPGAAATNTKWGPSAGVHAPNPYYTKTSVTTSGYGNMHPHHPTSTTAAAVSSTHLFETGKGRPLEVTSTTSSDMKYGVHGTIGAQVVLAKPQQQPQQQQPQAHPPPIPVPMPMPMLLSTIPASWTKQHSNSNSYSNTNSSSNNASVPPPIPSGQVPPAVIASRPARSID